MSALVFLLTAEKVCVAMDSLALYGDTKEPFKYITKLYPLLHLRSLICGTGCMNLIDAWVSFVQPHIVAKDILFLDSIAPQSLNDLHKQLNLANETSATIYHFGFDDERQRLIGYAYRSKNDYRSEELQDGLGIKPDDGDVVQAALSVVTERGFPDGFVDLISMQRENDRLRPLEGKVGIGGEVHIALLDKSQITMAVSHRFPDYESIFREMLSALNDRR